MESVGKWLLYLTMAVVIGVMIVVVVSVAGATWKRLSGQDPPAPSPRMPPTESFLFYGVFKVLVSVLAALPATVLMGMVFSRIHKAKNLLDVFLGALDFLAYAIYIIVPVIFAYFYIYMGKQWRQAAHVAALLIGVTVIYWFVAAVFSPRQDGVLFILLFLSLYIAGPPLVVRWSRGQPPFAAPGPGKTA